MRVANGTEPNKLNCTFVNKRNCGKKFWGTSLLHQVVLILTVKPISSPISLKDKFGVTDCAVSCILLLYSPLAKSLLMFSLFEYAVLICSNFTKFLSSTTALGGQFKIQLKKTTIYFHFCKAYESSSKP